MARRTADPEPQLFEATTSIASEWIEQNALDGFRGGVCQQGVIVRAGHPILKAHGQWFEPVRAHREPRERVA
jgi:hypothetical protein